MDVGTSIVVNDYIATTAAAYEGIPFILNPVKISNCKSNDGIVPVKRYLNVIEYLEREGLSTYVNQISSKLQVAFTRSVFTYSITSNKKIIINIFFARMRSINNAINKGKNEILKVDYNSKPDENGDPNLSIINAAFAERQGSAIRAELMYGQNIQKDDAYNRFVITLQSCINDNTINNRTDVSIDQAFFFPIKSYEYHKLGVKCQSIINDIIEPSTVNTDGKQSLKSNTNDKDLKYDKSDKTDSNESEINKENNKVKRKMNKTKTGIKLIDNG
jgi:hypothetical protein